jgi:CheY-like chemotaxis protein
VLKLQGALLKKHNIDVIIDGKPLHLVGLKNDIKQVFMNLFSNSKDAFIKQSVYHPRVWIRVTETGVSFEDNAGGVPETILSKLFNAYFTTKPEGSGTGLGLHMCRQIVEEKMGGTIQASNTPNGLKIVMNFSTTAIFDSDEVDEPEESVDMNFSAPATEASLDGSVKQENSSAMLNVQELKKAKEQGVKSVLLVDDDEISRTILDEFLTANGYIVSNLENGQQALEILSHSEYLFDYVLMDIQMPILDGIDATKKARQRGVSIPILGLSAYTDVEHQKSAKEAGMLGLVSKPINAEKLLVRLSEIDKNSDHT